MLLKNKPILIFINSREIYGEKLSGELEEAGFRVQSFEKDSLALKFLERNNVHGIFIASNTLENAKELVVEIRKTENPKNGKKERSRIRNEILKIPNKNSLHILLLPILEDKLLKIFQSIVKLNVSFKIIKLISTNHHFSNQYRSCFLRSSNYHI
jgi:hypothetical protein